MTDTSNTSHERERKIVQFELLEDGPFAAVWALCDDGTLWFSAMDAKGQESPFREYTQTIPQGSDG